MSDVPKLSVIPKEQNPIKRHLLEMVHGTPHPITGYALVQFSPDPNLCSVAYHTTGMGISIVDLPEMVKSRITLKLMKG